MFDSSEALGDFWDKVIKTRKLATEDSDVFDSNVTIFTFVSHIRLVYKNMKNLIDFKYTLVEIFKRLKIC